MLEEERRERESSGVKDVQMGLCEGNCGGGHLKKNSTDVANLNGNTKSYCACSHSKTYSSEWTKMEMVF